MNPYLLWFTQKIILYFLFFGKIFLDISLLKGYILIVGIKKYRRVFT